MRKLIWLVLIIFSSCLVAKKHHFSVDDMLAMKRVGSPAISADGNYVVFSLKSLQGENYKSENDLYLLDLNGKKRSPKRLTVHEAADVSPRWSADGQSIYYLSSRSGSMQLWNISIDGGKPRQVTDFPIDIDTYKLSRSNDTLVFTMSVYPDCNNIKCVVDRDKEKEKNSATGVVYDKLFVRHWDHWVTEKRNQLFAVAMKKGKIKGKPKKISQSLKGNIPSKPFGGAEEYSISADGKYVYAAMRQANRNEPWSTNFDIYAIPTDGQGKIQNLTQDNLAWDTHPVISPSGRYLAYLAMQIPGYEADRFRLMLYDLESGQARVVANQWGSSVADFHFSGDDTIIAKAQHVGNKLLFRIDVKSNEVRPLLKSGTVAGFDTSENFIVYGLNHLQSPTELYAMSADGEDKHQLTHINDKKIAAVDMGDFEQFQFKGADNDTVHGFIVKPVNFDANKKYPLAFLIHGGPQGSFSNNFHYRWNPQVYAGAGYVAVMIDFHGSTGYGQKFTHSISKDWGGKPLEDLQKGLQYALDHYTFIDENRMCALGASYGGYMINWIAGQWPDRFKCLVNHDGVFDMRSMYYTTEELWFPEYEQAGPYFDNPEQHEKHNPVNYVKNWKTPMLVIQGELDYRVPLGQSLGAFTALQRQGIESKLLYFPDENHWVLKPANSIMWHNEVLGWLNHYTGK